MELVLYDNISTSIRLVSYKYYACLMSWHVSKSSKNIFLTHLHNVLRTLPHCNYLVGTQNSKNLYNIIMYGYGCVCWCSTLFAGSFRPVHAPGEAADRNYKGWASFTHTHQTHNLNVTSERRRAFNTTKNFVLFKLRLKKPGSKQFYFIYRSFFTKTLKAYIIFLSKWR